MIILTFNDFITFYNAFFYSFNNIVFLSINNLSSFNRFNILAPSQFFKM